jgi:hypothetical protein
MMHPCGRVGRARTAFAAVALSICFGCGSQFELGQAKGTVTLDGKPLEGAVVHFYPIIKDGDPVPPTSSATTDASGNYEMVARTDQRGAAVGPHKVVVLYAALGGGSEPKNRPQIPQKYQLAAKSDLVVDVKSGSGDYPLVLKSK